MISTLGLAVVAACCLGASASAVLDQDAAGLVQSGVRTSAAVSFERKSAPALRLRSRTLWKGLAHAFLSDGRRWAKLLWGNTTDGLDPEPVPVAGDAAGCSEADRLTIAGRVQGLQDDMQRNMKNLLPKIMGQMASAAMSGSGGSMMVPFRVKGAITESPPMNIAIADLIKLPPACKTLVDQESTLSWQGVMDCAKDALGVSTGCVECVPQFGKQVQDTCSSMCMGGLDEYMESVDQVGQAAAAEFMKARNLLFGRPDLQGLSNKFKQTLTEGMKKLLPCAECFEPKATGLAGCLAGEAAAKEVEDFVKNVLIDGMKTGDLMEVEVGTGTGDDADVDADVDADIDDSLDDDDLID